MIETVIALLSVLFSIIGWLLRDKDRQQGEQIAHQDQQIKLLFDKHELDVQALQELRVQIAGRHYERQELDAKFERLETTFKEGFDSLGHKFDRLSDTLLEHVQDHQSRAAR